MCPEARNGFEERDDLKIPVVMSRKFLHKLIECWGVEGLHRLLPLFFNRMWVLGGGKAWNWTGERRVEWVHLISRYGRLLFTVMPALACYLLGQIRVHQTWCSLRALFYAVFVFLYILVLLLLFFNTHWIPFIGA